MKFVDVFEMAYKNTKRKKKKNIAIVVIFAVIIIVFNLTYTLTVALSDKASTNITDNSNLKIIDVDTVGEEISEESISRIREIDHVDMAIFKFTPSVSIDKDAVEATVLAMNSEQASYISGYSLELGDEDIILNSNMEDLGYKPGDQIEISYNARVTSDSGTRVSKKLTLVGFYQQPMIASWYENVFIVSQNTVNEIGASLYGTSIENFKDSGITRQTINVFIDEVDNVKVVADLIEREGLITSYGLEYSEGLPQLAKMIILIGMIIIVTLLLLGVVIMNVTLNNSLKERYREIGILKSIGINSQSISKILNLEVFFIWVVISIIATLMSVLVIKLLPKLMDLSMMGDLKFTVLQFIVSIAATYLVMIITTSRTIRKVSQLKTIDVLRSM